MTPGGSSAAVIGVPKAPPGRPKRGLDPVVAGRMGLTRRFQAATASPPPVISICGSVTPGTNSEGEVKA